MDNSHLLDIIRIIYNMQENITNNNCNLDTCTRPILGPSESLYNTRPFNLYLCNNNLLEIQGDTTTTSTFRVEEINGSCITVRLLNNENGEITSTNETATINMNCIAAIRCLQDINLTL